MAKDTWARVDDRLKQVKGLTDRMDTTRRLLEMEDFKLRDFKDAFDLTNVVNVTGNRLAAYGKRVIENLASYKWQLMIEGNITKTDSARMEEVLNLMMAWTNRYIGENFDEVPDLYTFWSRHICNRGRIGAMWLPYVEDGEFKVHCAPLDMRWTPYVRNNWACPIFFVGKDDLEQQLEQYEKEAKQKKIEFNKPSLSTTESGQDYEVRDYYDGEKREFWVEKKLVFTDKNQFNGKLPFVFVVAPSGNMFRDKGYKEHEGEDIYYLIRKLEKELNRSLSVESTIAFEQLFPAYEYPTRNFDAKPAIAPPKLGEVKKVPEGELHTLVPKPDINTAGMTTRADIQKMIDEGAPMAPKAYTQPPSAVEVATEIELLNQLYNSCVTALQTGLSQLYKLMVDLTLIVGDKYKGKVEVPGLGSQKSFVLSQFKDTSQYTISCRLMNKSIRMEMVNLSMAQAARGIVPDEIIIRDILKADDPAEWDRQLEMQKAKQANPAIGLAEMAVRYAEEGDEIEDETEKQLRYWQSMILVHDYKMAMRARMQPQQPEAPPEEAEKPNMQGLMSMPKMLEGGSLASAPRQEVQQQ